MDPTSHNRDQPQAPHAIKYICKQFTGSKLGSDGVGLGRRVTLGRSDLLTNSIRTEFLEIRKEMVIEREEAPHRSVCIVFGTAAIHLGLE